MGGRKMEKEILKEISEELKWYERITIKIHKRLIIKIYHKTRKRIFNNLTDCE